MAAWHLQYKNVPSRLSWKRCVRPRAKMTRDLPSILGALFSIRDVDDLSRTGSGQIRRRKFLSRGWCPPSPTQGYGWTV